MDESNSLVLRFESSPEVGECILFKVRYLVSAMKEPLAQQIRHKRYCTTTLLPSKNPLRIIAKVKDTRASLSPPPRKKKKKSKNQKIKKHTAARIRCLSPTQLLISRSEAYLWLSGREAEFSTVYGRM